MALTRLNNNAYGETISVAKGGTGVTTSAALANLGHRTLLNSTTVSSDVAQIAIDNTILTSDIRHLEIIVGDYIPSTTHGHLGFLASINNGSSFATHLRARAYTNRFESNTPGWTIDGNVAEGYFIDDVKGGSLDGLNGGCGSVRIYNIQGGSTKIAVTESYTRNSHNSGYYAYWGVSSIRTTSAINYIKLFDNAESGNISGGRFDFYGYKN